MYCPTCHCDRHACNGRHVTSVIPVRTAALAASFPGLPPPPEPLFPPLPEKMRRAIIQFLSRCLIMGLIGALFSRPLRPQQAPISNSWGSLQVHCGPLGLWVFEVSYREGSYPPHASTTECIFHVRYKCPPWLHQCHSKKETRLVLVAGGPMVSSEKRSFSAQCFNEEYLKIESQGTSKRDPHLDCCQETSLKSSA